MPVRWDAHRSALSSIVDAVGRTPLVRLNVDDGISTPVSPNLPAVQLPLLNLAGFCDGSVRPTEDRRFSDGSFFANLTPLQPDNAANIGWTGPVLFNDQDGNSIIAVLIGLLLPAEAVLHDIDQTTYVFIADREKNAAFKRKILVGALYDNKIEVSSGLNENELVVVGGQQKIQDGSLIQIKTARP